MSAARLFTSARWQYTALAAIACTGIHNTTRRRSTVSLDSPPGSNWPQDASLISHGQRDQRIQGKFAGDDAKAVKKNTKRKDAETIEQVNDTESHVPAFEDDDESSWSVFSQNFNNVKEGIARIEWSGIGGSITEYVLPSWARYIPDGIQKLQFEFSMKPGTLADDIWEEAHDPYINPEILWNARVRVGDTLGQDELRFRSKRKERIITALAKYLDIDAKDIHPDDVPTIAMCGSGGGLRALVAGTSSYLCAQEAGLFDCAMYTAGVSGSCWLQSLYFSTLGKQNHKTLLKHIKSRIGTHIAFPPPALKLVTSAPTSKFILSGFIEKLKGDPGAHFGLVDIYSLLLSARLLVPNGDLDVQDRDLKLSNQRMYLEDGQHPMPIYTAVRHEIPIAERTEEAANTIEAQQKAREKARQEAWFQWIEMHPWEVWCEEFGAGIPTWSLGRQFRNGHNELLDTGVALPETRQTLLLGIFGSAFCATLSHYYKEIKPALVGVAGFGGLDGLLEEKNEDLIKIHPIEPATIPNFVYGMYGKLPSTCPQSVLENDHLQLMDAGMSNNLPIYPLLRPGRDVDIVVAFDASADVQKENWLSVVDGYAKQRGIKSWPVGAGWPNSSAKPEENAQILKEAQARSPQEAATKVARAREERREQSQEEGETKTTNQGQSPSTGEKRPNAESVLGPCNVWVGTTKERTSNEEPPPCKRLSWDDEKDSTFHLMEPNAGMAVIYFPLLPNKKVEGVNPDVSDYLSTWNFIYTPEQIDKVVALARANFEEGQETTKRTVRAVYERKKKLRLEKEDKWRIRTWEKKLRATGDSFAGI